MREKISKVDEMLKTIEAVGMQAKGKGELVKHLYGERLNPRQMVIAKCYDCLGFMADGKEDCEMPTCPLYPLMPYRKGGEKYVSKVMTDEQRQKSGDRMRLLHRK